MTTAFILLGDVSEKFIEVSTKKMELIHYIVFLFVFTMLLKVYRY